MDMSHVSDYQIMSVQYIYTAFNLLHFLVPSQSRFLSELQIQVIVCQ